jgi:DNA mismatch repair protein MutL
VSREHDAEHGHEIESRGGAVGAVKVAAAPVGTRIEVRNLFRYVPARRKFLKTPGTEMSHVTSTLHKLALANPGVAFALLRGGNPVFRVAADEDRRTRVARFFGRKLFDQLLPVTAEEGGVRVDGFVARPEAARPTASWMHFFLNGRPIRDRSLSHAVRHAFDGLLTKGRHPVVFLFLELDPSRVDVNVHPAKTEVRFQDAQALHRLLRRSVRQVLLGDDLVPTIVPDAMRAASAEATTSPDARRAEYLEGVKDALSGFLERTDGAPREPSLYGRHASGTHAASRAPGQVSEPALPAPAPRAAQRFLQVKDSFLVFEVDDGLAIVDQHALHERIMLEEITERVRSGTLEVQPMLVPALVELPAADVEALLAEAEELAKIGVRLDRFGETTIAVQSLPSLLSRRDPGKVVQGLAERIRAGKGAGSRTSLLDELMHSMACRSAIMAGDALTEEQASELMRRADLIDNPQSCAHGRPTSLRLTFRELIRHFKR